MLFFIFRRRMRILDSFYCLKGDLGWTNILKLSSVYLVQLKPPYSLNFALLLGLRLPFKQNFLLTKLAAEFQLATWFYKQLRKNYTNYRVLDIHSLKL